MRDIFEQNISQICETRFNFTSTSTGNKNTPVFRVKVNIRGYNTLDKKEETTFLSRLKKEFTSDDNVHLLIAAVNHHINSDIIKKYTSAMDINITCPDDEDHMQRFLELRDKTRVNSDNIPRLYTPSIINPKYPDHGYEITVKMWPKSHDDFVRLVEVLPDDVIFSNSFHHHFRNSKKQSYFYMIEFVMWCKNEEDHLPMMFLPHDVYKINRIRIHE